MSHRSWVRAPQGVWEACRRISNSLQVVAGAQGRLGKESRTLDRQRRCRGVRGGGYVLVWQRACPPAFPLPFPKLRSSCSPQRGPRAATLQFGEGEGEGREEDLVGQNAAGLLLCLVGSSSGTARPAQGSQGSPCPCTNPEASSQFARVAKGVDLRSTGGNSAWVRTPQLTCSFCSCC